mgnify:CR=1 FL=1
MKCSESLFIDNWVQQMTKMLLLEDPTRDPIKINDYLVKYAESHIVNPPVLVVNNYRNVYRRDGLLEILQIILSGKVILGGDACLYVQHSKQLSVMYKVIKSLQDDRNAKKAKRQEYDKVTEFARWLFYDIGQGNAKIAVNALYGVLGYMKFPLFNVNLAQSITAMGQQIISTATCCFENFMSDNIKFVSFTELVQYISEINDEYKTIMTEEDPRRRDILALIDDDITVNDVINRLSRKVGFLIDHDKSAIILRMIERLEPDALKMLMFKNNVHEFNNTEFMRKFYMSLYGKIDSLSVPELYAFEKQEKTGTVADPSAKDDVKYLFEIYDVFVHYNHPIFDRVRRCRYTDKHSVLYIDTDSNFLGLDEFVQWSAQLMNADGIHDMKFIFKSVSVFTMVLSHVIKTNYMSFYQSLNMAPEHGGLIKMKNEFFFPILFFGLVKKRYIGLMLLQDGKMLNDGLGLPEIKGFDFKKAGTKKFVRDRFESIISDLILHTDQIEPIKVYKAFDSIKAEIRDAIMNNDTMFYKQATAKQFDQYKAPYSNQTSKSAIIWNILNPDDKLELPAEIDVIPINIYNGMTQPKLKSLRELGPDQYFSIDKNRISCSGLYNFWKKCPEQFKLYWDNIVNSPNELIQKFNMNVIGKPRSMSVMPDWLITITDIEKIIMDVVKLSNPILESLDFRIISASAKDKHYSNIINI